MNLRNKDNMNISHDHLISNILRYVSTVTRYKLIHTHPLQLLEWQANAILHSNFITHTTLFTQNSDTLHLYSVLHNTCAVTGNGGRCAFDSRPCTHSAIPSNDGIE